MSDPGNPQSDELDENSVPSRMALFEQFSGLRRVVDQLMHRLLGIDKSIDELKADDKSTTEDIKKLDDKLDDKIHEIDRELLSLSTSSANSPTSISIGTLIALLGLLGSGAAGYITLREEVAASNRTLTTVERELEHVKESHGARDEEILNRSKAFVNNMLQINNLKNESVIKNVSHELSVSLKLLEKTTIETSEDFSEDIIKAIKLQDDMRNKLNNTISSLNALMNRVDSVQKTIRLVEHRNRTHK